MIEENKPEVADFTPSRLASHLEVEEFCEAIKCLKCLFLGGEQFSTKVYENFRKYSDAIVYNSYGPTETTITSNNKKVTDANDITVGYPLYNYVTDVRDIDGKLLPPFSTIEGMGDKAADAVEMAAADGPYLSLDDFRQRTKVSTTNIELMSDLGLFGDLPDTNQLSLFDFV